MSYRPHGAIGQAVAEQQRRRYWNPPRPRPRTPAEDTAVQAFEACTPCPRDPLDGLHLIPATATICLRCGTDAMTPTLEGLTP